MRQAGQPHSRWHHLGYTATSVAADVGVIAGALLGVVGSVVTPLGAPVLAAGAAVLVVAAFAVLLADQERRWRRSDGSLQSHFLPDGTPSMTVTAFGDGAVSGRGRTAFRALVDAATERQVGLDGRLGGLGMVAPVVTDIVAGTRLVPPADRRRTGFVIALGGETHSNERPRCRR